MIDWDKSAELNKCTIKELKAYFRRFNQSHKKVVAICEDCGEERVKEFRDADQICKACDNIRFGKSKPSDETLAKMRKAQSGENNPRYGVAVSYATRKKMSVSRMGHTVSPEARAKSRAKQSGVPKSDAARVNMSKAAIGNTRGSGNKGKTHTEATKRHMSATRQNIPYDEWESFACEKKYCPKFDETCRESNREKYGRRCFICNKTEKANGQKLSVHHVDMDRAQGCESNWKLVPLCRSCHSKAHNDEIIARLGFMVKR